MPEADSPLANVPPNRIAPMRRCRAIFMNEVELSYPATNRSSTIFDCLRDFHRARRVVGKMTKITLPKPMKTRFVKLGVALLSLCLVASTGSVQAQDTNDDVPPPPGYPNGTVPQPPGYGGRSG